MKQPMLGVDISLSQLRYPVAISPKLDGVRCLGVNHILKTRTMKVLPNNNLQHLLGSMHRHGWDGELIVGDPTAPDVYRKTVSEVMTRDGSSTATWYIFDRWDIPSVPFASRWLSLPEEVLLGGQIRRLPQYFVENEADLLAAEDRIVAEGYEGLMVRNPLGIYKYGRSTVREGLLLKLKRFTDAEAPVTGFQEREHNDNIQTTDERGYAKRSSHQSGKRPAGDLGALLVDWQGQTLRIGTGFTAQDRIDIWNKRDHFLGKLAKFKYLPVGMKDLPRHPVWLGWRHPEDM